ncbi:hypothetical protein DFJ63DRAFT_333733 [Scheffersomyces coipomensis]|uniref:uncharacterized protein n=1 Tax=Scheffersomyces coipomensis TaxID=1788519 RepID=UPI00315D9D26
MLSYLKELTYRSSPGESSVGSDTGSDIGTPDEEEISIGSSSGIVLFLGRGRNSSSSSSSGEETPSSGYDLSDSYETNSEEDDHAYTYSSSGKTRKRMSFILGTNDESTSGDDTEREESPRAMIPRPVSVRPTINIRDSSIQDKLAEVGPKYYALLFGVQYMKRKPNIYTKVFEFLIKNKSALESSHNLLLLVRSSIACAYGGRRMYNNLPPEYSLYNMNSRFQGICGRNRELNVSLLCTIGHALLYYAYEAGQQGQSLNQKVPGCKYNSSQTFKNLGGNHIWESGRERFNISKIKWQILNQYSRTPFEADVFNGICGILGIKTDYGIKEQDILTSLLQELVG